MMKNWLFALTAAAVLGLPGSAFAQNVVAFFAPNLDFKDGSERNAYVNKVAQKLSSETGMAWEGRAFARASDFEAAKGSADVVILDADYFSSKGGSFQPVAMLSAGGSTTRAFKVIAKKGSGTKLYQYRNKRLALVANTSMATAFFSATALGHEVKASDYFSSIDEVRDVRSAINAVEMGKADIALVFDGYDSGFTTVYTSSSVALPVVAVNTSRLSEGEIENITHAVKQVNVRAASFITGIAGYSASETGSYKRIAGSKKASGLTYQPVEPENTKILIEPSKLAQRKDGIAFNSFMVQYAPTLAEFDRKLEQTL